MFRKIYISGLITLGGLFLLNSCGINSDIMFKTPKGVEERTDSIPLRPATEYQISPDDKFSFTMYTQNGEQILRNMTGVSTINVGSQAQEYLVRRDGTAEVPVKGAIRVSGLTVHQLEDTLASIYYREYQNPFIQVELTNQRVIVFPGSGGEAQVIPLQNNNTTLMEALAMAGGIAERGKSSHIKLMRTDGQTRVVYVLDLSTVEGLKYADMVVQANDYIYVEPNERLGSEVLQSTAPLFTIISSTFLILTIFLNLNN